MTLPLYFPRAVLPLTTALAIAAGVMSWNTAIAKPRLEELSRRELEISVVPIAGFDRFDGARQRFGKLIWRGGLQLSSSAPAFGGFSGLALTPDGERLIAVSDGGSWLTATLGTHNGVPTTLANAVMGPITGLKGKVLKRENERDVEGLTLLPDGASVLVAYERTQRLVRHSFDDKGIGKAQATIPLPDAVRKLKANKGLESVAQFSAGPAEGAILTFAERRQDSAGLQIGWLVPPGKAKPRDVRLARTGVFDLTDLAALPDGGFVVLWRSFSWQDGVRMRLERISPDAVAAALKTGEAMAGDLLFEADQRFEIDNMEGVAVSTNAAGDTELTLISDDNFSWLQRTLLLRFTIAGETVAKSP